MILTSIQKTIAEIADKHGVDPALALAIAEVESGFDTYAVRFEPKFRWTDTSLPNPPVCTVKTEEILQATSWGLMQVMGVVAVELGHRGWLTELTRPEHGAKYGVMHLKKKIEKYGGKGIEAAVSAYNAGAPITGNKAYVDKVMVAKVRWEKALG